MPWGFFTLKGYQLPLKFPKSNQVKRYKRTKAEDIPDKGPESGLQQACETYLEYCHIEYIRIPDLLHSEIFGIGGILNRVLSMARAKTLWNRVHALRRVLSKCFTGKADLIVLYSSGQYLAIELKSRSGEQSQGQKTFENNVDSKNYHIIRSVDAFTKLIEGVKSEKF